MKTILLSVAFFVGLLGRIDAETKEASQAIDHPHKNEYASVLVGSDKHKYGYELKQNRQFHHTTTEEDGVRLGCYGHILEGKKYSTQYVADVRGYRPVLTHDAITVYPKSGGERKASFVGEFNEDQQRSENIRYFFPDGCKGSDINLMPAEFPLPNPPISIAKKNPEGISPSGSVLVPIQSVLPPFAAGEKPPGRSVLPPPAKVVPPATKVAPPPKVSPPKITATVKQTPAKQIAKTPGPVIKRPAPAPSSTPKAAPKTTPKKSLDPLKVAVPLDFMLNKVPEAKSGSCEKTCCSEDESVAKLVLPISMKSLGKSTGSCETFAKLVIPVEGLNPDSLKTLTRGGDTADLIKTILQSLS